MKGDPKEENGRSGKQEGIEQAEHDGGDGLADENFKRPERCHQKLVKGSEFPFPGYGKGGENHDDNHGYDPSEGGDNIPATDKVFIEPGPVDQFE